MLDDQEDGYVEGEGAEGVEGEDERVEVGEGGGGGGGEKEGIQAREFEEDERE